MSMCPVRDCENEVPDGGFTCPDCHLLMPKAHFSLLVRTRLAASRRDNPDIKQHLKQQLHGYLRSAVREIEAVRIMR